MLAPNLSALGALRETLTTLARLQALALLGEPGFAGQRVRAREAARRLSQAQQLDAHLRRGHRDGLLAVSWPAGLRAEVAALAARAPLQLAAVQALIDAQEALARQQATQTDASARGTPLLEPAVVLLAELLPSLAARGPPARFEPWPERAEVTQVLHGPPGVPLDPVFKRSFSLLDEGRDLSLSGLEHDRAPYYWCLANREAMAAELCALCLIEYDGLPLDYFCDFARQAWDEVRHAEFFLRLGLHLLPGFVAQAPAGHPLLPDARAHLETGAGLPVPREGNLYEAARAGTLVERLVLMHHDEETIGLGGLVQQAASPFWRARPAFAAELEVTVHDEAFHTRLGRRWLEHLEPDRAQREARIEEARALRGFHILQSLSAWSGRPLADLLDTFASTKPAEPAAIS